MHADTIRLEAEGLLSRQDVPGALQRFGDLVRQYPDQARNWQSYGLALNIAGRRNEAIEALQRASGLDPCDVESRTTLGMLFESRSQLEEAIHWHGQALSLSPDSLVLRLNHAFVWPVVPESNQQIRDCRDRCQAAFRRILHDPAVFLHPSHGATNHSFGLAYHGIDDRALLEAYGQLVHRHVSAGHPAPPAGFDARERSGSTARMRLGFLSNHFYGHSNTRAFEGLLRGLDRDRFELVLIHLSSSRDDAARRRLDAGVDQVMHCPANLGLAWQQLRALRLDLLFITDIGMTSELPALLSQRCAPVQVTGWGFPRTSGLPMIDHYISGDLVEPADAQEHYSETLVRLSGLPCRYLSEELAVDPLAQEHGKGYFLLPDGIPLVGCLQTFWKLHPDFDAVLERIAQAVPEALFVFIEPKPPELAEVFLNRLRRSAPCAAERVVVLAGLKRAEYLALTGCLDLLLDTLHFGSGISFYESICSGTPMVTVEGPFLRSRFVAGGYRLMQVEEAPVARTPEQMATLAIRLLQDPEHLGALRTRLREAALAHLYDRMDMVHSFEAFAIDAINRSRHEVSR